MTSDIDQVDATSRRPSSSKQLSYSVVTVHRPSSPLKHEVLVSPGLASSPPPLEHDDAQSVLRRNNRVYDQTQRWTFLAREAEADEVSILSVTSEEKDYLNALVPDGPTPATDGPSLEDNASGSRVGSMISGFDEGAFVERESTGKTSRDDDVASEQHPDEPNFDDTIQFAELTEVPDFTPPEPPRPKSGNYVYYPIPIPRQLMLPPRLTGPNASKEIPPIATYRPPSVRSHREHAQDFLDNFLDTHETALQEDPDVILQPEFDSNTLLGTLINNLRDTKQEIKCRARTNADYVPGGKSLLEMDRDAAQRITMGKALSSRGGRNWGTSVGGSSSPRRNSHVDETPQLPDTDVFESISLAEFEHQDVDEDVPLAMVQTRIVTQRHDAEESLADRMKRLKEEKRKKDVKEGETLKERLARLKLEKNETLQERRQRLLKEKAGNAL